MTTKKKARKTPPPAPVNPSLWRPKGDPPLRATGVPTSDDLVFDAVGALNRLRAVMLADMATRASRERGVVTGLTLMPTDGHQIGLLTGYGLAVAATERAMMMELLGHYFAPLAALADAVLTDPASARALALGVLELRSNLPGIVEHNRGPVEYRRTVFPDRPMAGVDARIRRPKDGADDAGTGSYALAVPPSDPF